MTLNLICFNGIGHYMSHIPALLALMLLAFNARHMMRSADLALSPKRLTAQFVFAVSNRYLYEKIHTASLGTAKLADLSTRHHSKPSPKGSGSMWWLVLRWAHLAFPTMPYAYIPALLEYLCYGSPHICWCTAARSIPGKTWHRETMLSCQIQRKQETNAGLM